MDATGTGDFLERLSARLRALGASQDLLVQTNWSGANLALLIENQLLHFKDLLSHRIWMRGPEVKLTPQAAQALGMAVH